MALAHGYALPFEAIRRTGVLSQNAADAAVRASNDAGSKEAAGSCLDGRALDLQQRTIVQPSILIVPQLTRNGVVYNQIPNTRTNYIQNNVMAGATGSVIPNLWSAVAPPSGITVSYSASGQTTAADGATVNYIDVTVSGTALASGNFNLRQLPSPSPVSGNMLFTSGAVFTASTYLALVSGAVSGISPNYQLQEVSGTTFVTGSSLDLSTLTSSLTQYNLTRTLNGGGGADRVQVRWGHAIASGQVLNYTIRIASPQLEKRSAPMPIINTTSGFVTVDANGVARDGAPPDFTFTRATTATRVNASGLIESVASGLLRLDYPVTGGCPAALIEASGTNVALRSAGIDVSGTWQRTNISAVTSGITSPEGTATAFEVIESSDATAQTHELAQVGFSVVSGTTYTYSFFIKAGTNNRNLRLAVGGSNFIGSPVAIFSPASGTVVSSTDCTASIESYGNGWFRCRMTATADVAGSSFFSIVLTSGTTVNYIGNGSGSVQVWGAQMETGAIPTSYIPTTTASATRAAEVCSVSGVSGYIGQTEGTIYAEVDIRNMAKETYTLEIDDGVNANRIIIRSLTNNQMRGSIVAATFSGTIGISSATFTSGIVKIAFAYKSGDFALSVNGAAALTASGTFTFGASLNRITLGSVGGGGSQLNDRIRAAAIYTTRLSNDQLANLTRLT